MKYFIGIILLLLLASCQNDSKIDLEKLTFKEDVNKLLKNEKKFSEYRELSTSLPSVYTSDVDDFRFGRIKFSKDENEYNKVFFLFKDTMSLKIEGVKILIDNVEQNEKLFDYLKKKLGEPKELNPIPEPNREKEVLGFSSYLWENYKNDYFILFSSSYQVRSTNNKKNPIVKTTIFIVNNHILDNDSGITVLERLKNSFKE